MTMLAFVVAGLERFEQLLATVSEMGARHALMAFATSTTRRSPRLALTLGQGLGPAFTPDVEQAWVAAYTVLSDTMRGGVATWRQCKR